VQIRIKCIKIIDILFYISFSSSIMAFNILNHLTKHAELLSHFIILKLNDKTLPCWFLGSVKQVKLKINVYIHVLIINYVYSHEIFLCFISISKPSTDVHPAVFKCEEAFKVKNRVFR